MPHFINLYSLQIYRSFQNGFLTPLLVCCVVGHSTYDSACLLVQSDANINGAAQVSVHLNNFKAGP